MYGQSFTLVNESDNGLNAPSSGPGMAGQFTRAGGFLAYYEVACFHLKKLINELRLSCIFIYLYFYLVIKKICDTISGANWKVIRHPTGAMGPTAYKGNQWISYDDADDIRRKVYEKQTNFKIVQN